MATEQQIAEWKKVYDALSAEGETIDEEDETNGYWVMNESHYESICVGWCMGRGMTLTEALAFYQEMIPLELF